LDSPTRQKKRDATTNIDATTNTAATTIARSTVDQLRRPVSSSALTDYFRAPA